MVEPEGFRKNLYFLMFGLKSTFYNFIIITIIMPLEHDSQFVG